MSNLFWLVLVVVVGVAAILLEGRRQARKYGPPSGAPSSLMRAGVLGLQGMLEPEKKVEYLVEQKEEIDADLAADDRDRAES